MKTLIFLDGNVALNVIFYLEFGQIMFNFERLSVTLTCYVYLLKVPVVFVCLLEVLVVSDIISISGKVLY